MIAVHADHVYCGSFEPFFDPRIVRPSTPMEVLHPGAPLTFTGNRLDGFATRRIPDYYKLAAARLINTLTESVSSGMPTAADGGLH